MIVRPDKLVPSQALDMKCTMVHVPGMTALEHRPDGIQSPCVAETPTAPGQNQPLTLTDERIAANHRNAFKSTGPRR